MPRAELIALCMLCALMDACSYNTRTPMSTDDKIRYVGSVTGTIRVGATGTQDITECTLRTTKSKEGVTYAVDLVAPKAKYKLVVDEASDALSLEVPDATDATAPRSLRFPKWACTERLTHFFQRDHMVHGNVRLDCQTADTHVIVAASFDNCEP